MKITHYLDYEPLAIQARDKAIQKAHHRKIKKSITTYLRDLSIITLMLSTLLIILLLNTTA